jgi:alpha-glucosidase
MARSLCIMLVLISLYTSLYSQFQKSVSSPDGKTTATISGSDSLRISISYDNKIILEPSTLSFNLLNTPPLTLKKIQKATERLNESVIVPPVAEKRKTIPDHFRELSIDFRQPFSLIIRVYNDGVAYRFATRFKDSITVVSETANYTFPSTSTAICSPVEKRTGVDIYHTSFEELYQQLPIDSVTPQMLCFSPLLVKSAGINVLLTESDLEDYPGMFLKGSSSNHIDGAFAPYPLKDSIASGEFPQAIVIQRADYIAKTKGTRSFPWRIFAIAATDKELPTNDIVYRLGSPSRLKDVSWIKPGQATDEWIIDIALFNVPFKAGINTETYKYYIDFAKKFGFERILMDAGWSDVKDLFKINPNLNMDEVAAYAKSQGIGLSMWTLGMTLNRQLEPALDQFNKWGVDFIMTDFLDRDDQKMVDFYYKIAEACARHKIMIMYHGAYKPAGFSRTYPNAITREGVLGSEYNGWSNKPTPDHNLMLPYLRMVAGPLDYEPGLLDNATQSTFRPIWGKVMSQGTRCHQLAMFVVYDSPVQIFSGNPSQGLLEPRFMELLGSIPTTWDTTMVVDGKIGDYIITARKKDNDWYIGAMTDWSPRDFTIDLKFLDDGEYEAEICADGINAAKVASDYKMSSASLTNKDTLKISMAPGGGYLVRLRKK